MDAKELKRIGTRFYRTERAEKSGEMGTGIGLSIVSQIVHHHGGKLQVNQFARPRLLLHDCGARACRKVE